jgi:glycosyltransferase involved in cell wall biosynthesis
MTALKQLAQVWFENPWLYLSRVVTCAWLRQAVDQVPPHAVRWRRSPRLTVDCDRNSSIMTGSDLESASKKKVAAANTTRRGLKIGYVAASTLPYHVSGYTTRTHAIMRAFTMIGADVVAFTRPGYPWDRSDRFCTPDQHETIVDRVRYHHLRHPSNRWPVLFYTHWAASTLTQSAHAHQVDVMHAASNHVNALPALLAARRLGIPFYYEMRGLWELTRVSRQPDYLHSQAYRQGLALERLVATRADRLYVISQQLKHFVCTQWGVPEANVALLPNCVDPDSFSVAHSSDVESRTIGYAGSLIGYEGLDVLVEAIARLKAQGELVHVRIVGHGEAQADLSRLAQRLCVTDRIEFLGRMEPEAAQAVIRRCAVVCLPRRPHDVCRIIPPIKLVEALAMGKPVIVSDLPVLRDELGPHPAGWFFRAGDSVDLAAVIHDAFADESRLVQLGHQARAYAVRQRNWQSFVTPIMEP